MSLTHLKLKLYKANHLIFTILFSDQLSLPHTEVYNISVNGTSIHLIRQARTFRFLPDYALSLSLSLKFSAKTVVLWSGF